MSIERTAVHDPVVTLAAVHDPVVALTAVVDAFTVFVPPKLDFSESENSMYLAVI